MTNSLFHSLIFVSFFFSYFNSSAQIDSSKAIDKNKLEFSPTFHSVQIDANVFFISYEVGGHLDFDLFQTQKSVCLGTRVSVEHYSKGDFGGNITGSPFTNFNLYLRFSKISTDLSFNFLGGISYYNSSEPFYFPNNILPRIGVEIKYGRIIGIILNGATSFKENTGFIGIGLSLDYCHIL